MTLRKYQLWIVVIFAMASVCGCGPAEGPTELEAIQSPGGGEAPLEDGPESTTAVPAAAAAYRIFDGPSDTDCCNVSGGPYGRFGFRLDGLAAGFHSLTSSSGAGSCNNPPEDPNNGITLTWNGSAFDWESTMPIGAMIVGSAAGTRVYVYSPRSWGDSGLHGVVDPDTGLPAEILSLEFCYDYALRIGIGMDARWTRSVQWELQQSVTPDSWDLFPGDRGISQVQVDVAPSGSVDTPPTAYGTLTLENPSPLPATVSSITNIISLGIVVPVSCPESVPFVLDPGESVVCSYAQELSDTSTRSNFVSVNTTSVVRGGSAQTLIEFGEQSVENSSINVVTSDGTNYGPFESASSFSFEAIYDCGMIEEAGGGGFTQQATIVGTQQRAEQPVALRCIQPSISQQLSGSHRQSWSWSLTRHLESNDVLLASGRAITLDGSIEVAATPRSDDFRAEGVVVIENPHPSRSLLVTGLDAPLITESGGSLACAEGVVVPAGGSVRCDMSMTLPDGSAPSSGVRMVYQNHDLRPDGSATASTTSELESVVALNFDSVSSEMDRCAQIRDDVAGVATDVCVDALPASLPASVQVGPYFACGDFELLGLAELVASDSGQRSEGSYSVSVHVTCADGCTRETGYWKSHAPAGPPPYDGTWKSLPEGGDTQLFLSGMSYVEVMWAATKGSPWIQLAQPWIAAHLNQLAGADPSVISTDFSEGEMLLRSTSPSGPFTQEQKAAMLRVANLLESWNAGEIGPGACPTLSDR